METHAFTSKNSEIVENFLEITRDFFDYRKVGSHLRLLDRWADQLSGWHSGKKRLCITELSFYLEKIKGLLDAAHRMGQENTISPLQEMVRVPENLLRSEQQVLFAWPNALKTHELCNPFAVIRSIFNTHPLGFYNNELLHWYEATEKLVRLKRGNLLYMIYRDVHRLIEACWLIHERVISKNSRLLFQHGLSNIHFSLSCPLLLKEGQLTDPYHNLETFFSFSTLDSYKHDLNQWFKVALTENAVYEHPSDLYFLYGQFTQLLHACYLIGETRMLYRPQIPYSRQHTTFGHWVLAITFPDKEAPYPFEYQIQNLPEAYHKNPVRFFIEKLTTKNIVHIRKRLEGWFEAAISHRNSLITLDIDSIYEQYELLLQLMEAAFLLIVNPALRYPAEPVVLPEKQIL